MTKLVALLAALVLVAGCGSDTTHNKPHAVPVAAPQSSPNPAPTVVPQQPVFTLPNAGNTTYTVEPFDGDQVLGITMTVTQDQFGGSMCPCKKIAYPADGLPSDNQTGANNIIATYSKMNPGDILMGFSLGVQVISLALSQQPPPPGVIILLAGDTIARNAVLVSQGQGIPWTIANQVIMVANEYDGWSDSPDITTSPNYLLAESNAGVQGALGGRLHYYANANITNPFNVITQTRNITAILVPTQNLPNNDWMRPEMNSIANQLDAQQRGPINSAYTRVASNAAQQAGAAAEQVPLPNPPWAQNPEPSA
jgi:hypothetical protein